MECVKRNTLHVTSCTRLFSIDAFSTCRRGPRISSFPHKSAFFPRDIVAHQRLLLLAVALHVQAHGCRGQYCNIILNTCAKYHMYGKGMYVPFCACQPAEGTHIRGVAGVHVYLALLFCVLFLRRLDELHGCCHDLLRIRMLIAC